MSPQVFPYYRDDSAVRGNSMGEQPTYIALSPNTLETNLETEVPHHMFSGWFSRRYEAVDTGCGSEIVLTVYAWMGR